MCGIAGLFGRSFRDPFPLPALRHRGPDSEGEWSDPEQRIWLGHTRLAILDLSDRGHQPMSCLGGLYRVVFNGEIYNFLELRQELESMGYGFQTESDTEVIAAAYDCWGAECLHRFNGMWAFALWDSRKRELWLSRDRFGKKPLYYYDRDDRFAFSSEVKALHLWLGDRAELDARVIRSICEGRMEWQGTERTYLANIRVLPAGHALWKSRDRLRLHRWYQLEPGKREVPIRLEEQAEEFRGILADACRLRLRSDVPLATCLSGGLDSSSLTALVHKGQNYHDSRTARDFHRVFSASFPNTILDEADKARGLAKSVGAILHVHEIKPPSEERILEAVSACDGPMHALAFYPIWDLYGFIRKNGVKVTLDGQGPDEMMGGYFETIRSALRGALLAGKIGRFRDILNTYSSHGENEYRSTRRLARAELRNLWRAPLARVKQGLVEIAGISLADQRQEFDYAHSVPPGLGRLSADLYGQFCQRELPTILQQYDRCSMAHGVECRMPFMDYRLVEFVFSLPETSIVGGGFTKRVLREAVKGLVPDETRLDRVKIGFNAPIVEWFLGPLRQLMLDTMASAEFKQSAFFDGHRLRSRFETWLLQPEWESAWAFWPPVHFVLWQKWIQSSFSFSQRRAGVRYG